MSTELPRPGVSVLQVFRSTSPTVITPALVPCCVGVCKQVVEVLDTTATGGTTRNDDALVTLPASFTAKPAAGSPPVYGGLDGLSLVLSINHAPEVSILFTGNSLSVGQVVATIASAFASAGVTAATVELVGTRAFRVRTIGTSDYQSIFVAHTSSPAVLAAFGLGAERTYAGTSSYTQRAFTIHKPSFPDPRHNLTQLAIDDTTIRAFLFFGGINGTVSEVRRNRTFLRSGGSTAAALVGTTDLSTAGLYGSDGSLHGSTLTFAIDGAAPLTVTFAAPADAAAALAQITAVVDSVAAVAEDTSHHLVVTSLSAGATSSVHAGAAAATTLGLSTTAATGASAIQAIDSGTGAAVTSLLQCPGQDFTAAATGATLTGTASVQAGLADHLTVTLDDGTGPQTLSFSGADSEAKVLAQLNALFGADAGGHLSFTASGSHHLVMTHALSGGESFIQVVGGTGLTALGLTVGTTRGTAHPPLAGDVLYVDGVEFGVITQVAPGGVVTNLRIDRQLPINASLGASFYIVATGLPATGRPTPDLVVGSDGTASLKPELLRDTTGHPVDARAQVYLAYQAVRRDVSPLGSNPGLLRFNTTQELSSTLSPVSTDNPLALGLYFALLNATGTQVTGLGVDATSPAAPYGTVEAFSRAAAFLEGYEVYAIAPLTHDPSVGQIFSTHVTAMSEPDNKGERICLFNPAAPRAHVDTLVASGLNGNSTTTTNTFDTGIANLGALLLARGVNPVGPLLVNAGVLLDVGDGNRYAVVGVSGALLTVRTSGFAGGENDDGYYASAPLPSGLISQTFAVRIRGAALQLPDGTPDKDGAAETYKLLGQAYLNRRLWQIVPEKCAAALDGVEQTIEGFYLGASVAGMIAKQPPQQSFTNFPMTGFTRVIGSNDYYSEPQLSAIAAGGNYIIVQDGQGVPLTSRHALTTDMTSIETRTDSITKVVDYCAKFLRRGLRNFIGRFNINQGFLDSLGHIIQGLGDFLKGTGVLVDFNLNNIIQDEAAPDSVLVDCTLDVPYPCNYIRLTLVI